MNASSRYVRAMELFVIVPEIDVESKVEIDCLGRA